MLASVPLVLLSEFLAFPSDVFSPPLLVFVGFPGRLSSSGSWV